MRIVASKLLPSTHARMATDFLSTDGHCIELYYMIKGMSMVQVQIRGEDLIEHQLEASIIEVITIMYTNKNQFPNLKHAESYDQENTTVMMLAVVHKTTRCCMYNH